jgi:hypothetical protein
MTIETITFHFVGQLADSCAVVDVQCQIDEDGDAESFDYVKYEGFNVYDVLSQNQWDDLEIEASKKFKAEQDEQVGIDHDNQSPLEPVYGILKPSIYIR